MPDADLPMSLLPERVTSQGVADRVLIVDDVPDNLSMLHDALDAAGYTVFVATHGEAALLRAAQAAPDIVLLDAMMPGMDGFQVARHLKAEGDTAHIPIIFMTGLTETEHVVAAFEAGGTDYVTKPLRPAEVLARMAVHLRSARQARQARHALDAFGHATMAIHFDAGPAGRPGRAVWQTPLARRWMQVYFDAPDGRLPEVLEDWLRLQLSRLDDVRHAPQPLVRERDGRQLVLSLQQRTGDDDWLIVMREVSDAATVSALLATFKLTLREAEVLYWVAKGKTNRDIGDILGSSPATVKKHLEHVFVKLGVETRNAAAALAIQRVRVLVG
jgi:CheY-like chemotaxis protein/DNA-binding CsgD family transcriptional regulator